MLVPLYILVLFAGPATAASNTFAQKAINLQDSDTVAFYNAVEFAGSARGLEDPHPVHGIQTSDGGYIIVGKAQECGDACQGGQNAGNMEAYAIKISADGASTQWSWRSNSPGSDAANSVAELPNGGGILVAGFRTVNGIAKRSVTKLDLATGTESSWPTATDWGDDSRSSNGAWESIVVEQGLVLLGGLKSKPDTVEMFFKSYGNTWGGTAVVVQLPVNAFQHATKSPSQTSTGFSSYSPTPTSWHTVKKVAAAPNGGGIIALLWRDEAKNKAAGLVKLPVGSKQPIWGPVEYGVAHGEGTDVIATADGTGFVMTGHGVKNAARNTAPGALLGQLTKVDATNGGVLWSTAFGSCGGSDPAATCGTALIKNECWGLQETSDGGFAVACGTGIEDCNGMTGSMLSDCRANRRLYGDTRTGAYPFKKAVWQSLFVRTDSRGGVLWQRVDAYRPPGSAPLPTASRCTKTNGLCSQLDHSSAAEHVIKATVAGKDVFVLVNDESTGAGILKFDHSPLPGGGDDAATTTTTTTTTTSSAPTPPSSSSSSTTTTTTTTTTSAQDPPSAPASTLVIGDSFAEYGKSWWANYCGGITVTNKGVGGTTSQAWSSGDLMEEALGAAPGATKIIYTIGGNDYMGPGDNGKCTMNRAQVKNVVTLSLSKLVNYVVAAGKSAGAITMIGYPLPTADFSAECSGASPSALETLNGGIEDACKALGVGYLDMRFAGGAPRDPLGWSPGKLHQDAVHLNERGYCAVAITDSFRSRFSCTVKKEDQNCYDPTNESRPTTSTSSSTTTTTSTTTNGVDTTTTTAGASTSTSTSTASTSTTTTTTTTKPQEPEEPEQPDDEDEGDSWEDDNQGNGEGEGEEEEEEEGGWWWEASNGKADNNTNTYLRATAASAASISAAPAGNLLQLCALLALSSTIFHLCA